MTINKFEIIKQVQDHFYHMDTPPPDKVVIFPQDVIPVGDTLCQAKVKTIVGKREHSVKIAFAVKDGSFVPASWKYVP